MSNFAFKVLIYWLWIKVSRRNMKASKTVTFNIQAVAKQSSIMDKKKVAKKLSKLLKMMYLELAGR